MNNYRRSAARGAPLIATLLALMCIGSQVKGAAQCPMFRYDSQHTGRTDYAVTYNPKLAWTYTTGINASASPVAGQDGTVYYGALNKNFYAIDPEGSMTWQYSAGGMIPGSAAIAADGSIYFGASTGKFYALNSDGSAKWSSPFNYGSQGSCTSTMIGRDGTIYFGADDNYVYALNPDGTLKWSYNAGDKVKFGISESMDGSVIYATTEDGSVHAINSNGTSKWKSQSFSSNTISAIGNDGTIYVGGLDGALYALNESNGSQKWVYRAQAKITSAIGIGLDGSLYFGSDDRSLYALDSNGILKWAFRSNAGVYSAPTIDRHGKILFGTFTGDLIALSSGGSLEWIREVGTSTIYTSPMVASDGSIYVLDSSGLLSKFEGPVLASPEPSSLVALASGIIAAVGATRRNRFRRK